MVKLKMAVMGVVKVMTQHYIMGERFILVKLGQGLGLGLGLWLGLRLGVD